MAKITMNGVTIDPLAQGSALAAADLIALDSNDSDYLLVQTNRPLDKDSRRELADLGVEVQEYVPDDTYLCHYEGTDLSAIRALDYVTWANVYLREFKINPSLMGAAPPAGNAVNALAIADAQIPALDTTPKEVDVVLHAAADGQSVRDQLAEVAQLDPSDLNLMRQKVRLRIAANKLNDLAAIDAVRQVEEVFPMKLHNDVARRILRVEPPPVQGVALEGEGQVVAVCDTGFDKGSTTDVHTAFTGRVAKLYALGRNKANDPHGHGTHVAGSVLGDGTSQTLGHTVAGTAPAARLVLQSVLDGNGGLGGLPADLNDLFSPPFDDDGARIHTNSWGSTLGDGRYNSNSREVDEFAQAHRNCLVVFAAGNEGEDANANGVIDPRSITPPGTAKNCLTVGACENDRQNFQLTYGQGFGFPANPIASDRMANDPDGMVAFSSRGPTADGRIKPDVVAPGSYILSTRSRDTSSNGWAASQDSRYFFNGGTSMATPLVAGCAAVVREFLAERRQMADPSAALVKAMLINGARNIAGQYVPSEADGIPNHSEGFGRVDLAATLDDGVQLVDEGTELDTGDEEITTVTVASGASLKVTLVWCDPPGPTLQNDLDLVVRTTDGQERHGNMAPGSADFDRVNNVEQVTWAGLPGGDVDIVVRAHRIPATPQSYALVIRVEGSGAQPLPELEVDGPVVHDSIAQPGDRNLYTFTVSTPDRYTIETSGSTDTFLSLFGPDDDSRLVAEDDDSGPNVQSRIRRQLDAGRYLVRVRHFSPTQTGAYGIRVRRS